MARRIPTESWARIPRRVCGTHQNNLREFMKKLGLASAAIATSLLFSGCASVNMASKEESALAKEFKQPAPGQALKKDIWLDGKCIGESANKVFFYTQVPGGKNYKIDTESEFSPNTVEAMLTANKNYFFRQFIKMGVFVGGAGIEQVPEEQGKKEVAQLEMAKLGSCSGAK
jgi:hypothetical protein